MYKSKSARILRFICIVALILVSGFGIAVRSMLAPDASDPAYYILFGIVFFLGLILLGHVLWEEELLQSLQSFEPKPRSEDGDEFVYIASHQLRSFPATIKWYLDSILKGTFGQLNDEAKTAVMKVQLMNNLQAGLIEDLLSTSRVDRGRLDFNFVASDLVILASSVIEIFQPQAESKNIKLEYKIAKQKIPVTLVDREKIKQVISNLIDNAIKFTRKGKVVVSIDKKDKYIVITVADTGEGLTKDQQKQIFLRFTRGIDTEHVRGLGLGLYVAKTLIAGHNGKIEVSSKGLGKGTTFKIYIPIR